MKFYIVNCGTNKLGTIYNLITEKGEPLAGHMCSSKGFAKSDLKGNRPDRQKKWKEKFGNYKILFLGDDNMTEEKLIELNIQFNHEQKVK